MYKVKASEPCTTQKRPTKHAPDAGDSGAIPSSFLRLSIFLGGRRSAVSAPARVTQTVSHLLAKQNFNDCLLLV